MSTAPPTSRRTATVMLVGNPNVGKSTVFNHLTRARQRVVNAPGTTVTLAQGTWTTPTLTATLIDLPGTYSLIARSPDELVAADAVTGGDYDLAVVVLDATALSRSLYLLGQVAAAHPGPLIAAVTMMDLARSRGIAPDLDALAQALGIPTIALNGRSGAGADSLAQAVTTTLAHPTRVTGIDPARHRADPAHPLECAENLFDWVHGVLEAAQPPVAARRTLTDHLDRILLTPWAGIPVFLAVVWGVFQLTTSVATSLMDAVTGFMAGPVADALTKVLTWLHAPQWLTSLSVDGALSGVGTVLSFVPLMAIMFAAVAVLEGSGYLARVAVVADRAMRALGLDGRAMLPLIVGFGCNVPALAATAVLPHARQRLLTGLLVPLTTCTARLAIYLMLAHTFIPDHAGTVVFAMYVAAIVLVIVWGLIARHTVMRDITPEPLVIALPDYQLPHLRTVGLGVWTRVASFVTKAGTVIMMAVVALWAVQAIPVHGGHRLGDVPIEDSVYGVVSESVAPALEPMGLNNWRVSAALISGVAAKEVVIGALAQSYALDGSDDATLSDHLRATITDTSNSHPTAAALALMVFSLSYLPCLATMAEQRRLFGWRWTALAGGAQLTGSYLLAIAVFQVGVAL